MRDLSPNFAAACASQTITPGLLVFLDFADSAVRAWSGLGPLNHGAHNWWGFGEMLQVEPMEEYSEIRAGQLTLRLTYVPGSQLWEARELVFKRRAAEIHLALFAGSSRTLIGVELLFRGTMDTLKIERSPQGSTISLTLTNELAVLNHSWGSLYTHDHQSRVDPTDMGLRHVPKLQNKEVTV